MSGLLAWCGHDLEKHLTNTALFAKGDPGALAEAVARSRERLGITLNVRLLRREVESTAKRLAQLLRGDALSAVALAAYLHDVGKAISTYQLRLRRAGPGCKTSLRGHEVWSAWVAYHVAERLWGRSVATAVAAGVALHHSARRSLDDVVLDALKVWPSRGDLDRMFSLAERGVGMLGLDVGAVVGAEATARYEWLGRSVFERLRSRLLSRDAVWGELITHIITIADNLDSALSRGEARLAYVLRPLAMP